MTEGHKGHARPVGGAGAKDNDQMTSPKDTPAGIATVDRCCVCRHPVTNAVSRRLGIGPVCRTRFTEARRAAVVARLDDLAARLTTFGVRELALVSAGVDDLLDALDTGAVA